MALCAGAALVLSYLHWKAQRVDPRPPHQKARRDPHQKVLAFSVGGKLQQAAWRELQGAGRSLVRKMGRNAVYLASMAISFAIYAAIEPFVSRWQFVRDGLGWFLLIGFFLAAAMIFFILELCGVYLSGRPLFARRKRTAKASGSNRWRYRTGTRGPNGFGSRTPRRD